MKAQSIIAIATLLLAATGCIAQAGNGNGTDESSSAEELNTQNAPGLQTQGAIPAAIPATNLRERTGEQPRVKNAGELKERDENVELSGPNGDPGDPSQDPGDPLDPDPHPWHSTTATTTK